MKNWLTWLKTLKNKWSREVLKQTLKFLQQIYVKNVHPEYSAGIRPHRLRDMSLLP